MTFGERLLGYRTNIKKSQEKLAEEVGVSRQTISKWETNQSTPDFDKILPLCNALGTTPEELITGEVKKANEAEEVKKLELEKVKEEIRKKQMEYANKRNKKNF